MNLQQLEYIIALDELKHFGAAADHCFVSQPTLSMMIQKLEDELGAKIFNRSKHPVLTTEIGKKIIAQARTILLETKRLDEIINETKEEIKGDFKLGIIPTLAPYLLPLFLGSFTKLGVWEDALAVLYPVTKKTSTLLRKMIVPPGLPWTDLEGKTVGAASPNAFNVGVEGDIVDDKLTLTLGDARSDISDLVEAHVTYLLVSPMTLVPVFGLPVGSCQSIRSSAVLGWPVRYHQTASAGAMG